MHGYLVLLLLLYGGLAHPDDYREARAWRLRRQGPGLFSASMNAWILGFIIIIITIIIWGISSAG